MFSRVFKHAVLVAGLLLFASAALAQDAPDEATVPGELRVKMNAEYARLTIDDEEWSQHEFSGDGRTIFIKEIDRTKDHTIKLSPTTGGLGPVEFSISPKDFKKKRQKDKTYHFVADKSIKFAKVVAPPTPAPAPDPDTGDEPTE